MTDAMTLTLANSSRFSVVRVKHGPCLVLDLASHRKTVASTFEPDAAEAFAKLMNGDVRNAMASREAAIVSLGPVRDHPRGERVRLPAILRRLSARWALLRWRLSTSKQPSRALF